jgi:hypothetical protein
MGLKHPEIGKKLREYLKKIGECQRVDELSWWC